MSDFNPLAKRSGEASRSLAEAMDELTTDGLPGLEASIGEDGTLYLGAFILTPVGLKVQGQIDEDDWLAVGGALRRLQSSLQWLIGDWLLVGEREWGVTYEKVAALTGYDVATLRDCAYVSSHVRMSIRIDKLSWTHHRLIAALPEDEQRQWLKWAASQPKRPSVAALRAALQGVELAGPKRGVDRLTDGALRLRDYAARMARSVGVGRHPEQRAALVGFAREQEAYWREYRERLESIE